MLTSSISFVNFKKKIKYTKVKKNLKLIIDNKNQNQVIKSLSKNYKYSFKKKKLDKYRKFSNFRVIGMGGSILGTQSIYEFLKNRIKKKFLFIDNLQNYKKKEKKRFTNLIVSKSGNTTETIVN